MTTPVPRPGKLYLVPCPLDFGCDSSAPLTDVIPQGTMDVALGLNHWIAENAKTTRSFIKRVLQTCPEQAASPEITRLQERSIVELPRQVHKKGDARAVQAGFDAKTLLTPALAGHNIGLISEAGMPAVADPGSSVVQAAHQLGIEVRPLTGPCALLLALAASGLQGQSFAFVGYLPQDATERQKRLQELETWARKTGQTQLWIETPYRNSAMLQAMFTHLQASTQVLVACGLTLEAAQVRTLTVAQWKKTSLEGLTDLPCVFGLGG